MKEFFNKLTNKQKLFVYGIGVILVIAVVGAIL